MEDEGADMCPFRNMLSSRAIYLLRATHTFHFGFLSFLTSAHFEISSVVPQMLLCHLNS